MRPLPWRCKWLEWDDLEFHTLPTEGTRLSFSADRSLSVESEARPYWRSTAYLTPNLAVLKIGLPCAKATVVGTGWQVRGAASMRLLT